MLTKKRRSEIQLYVDQLRTLMALIDWQVTVELEGPVDAPDALAQIFCTYGQRSARISVAENFDDHTLREQRIALVHELLHCHLNRIRVSSINTFARLGNDPYEIAKSQIQDEIEYATDSIAQGLAPLCPLPPWRKR